jgi:hypothetical protein
MDASVKGLGKRRDFPWFLLPEYSGIGAKRELNLSRFRAKFTCEQYSG